MAQYISAKNIWNFSPQTIANCVLWLNADDSSTIVLTNNKVSEWTDRSINAFPLINATTSAQPTYVLNSVNNRASVVFDGTQFLYKTGVSNSTITVNNEVTVFMVHKPSVVTGVLTPVSWVDNAVGGGIPRIVFYSPNNLASDFDYLNYTTGRLQISQSNYSTTIPRMECSFRRGTTQTIRAYGTPIGTLTASLSMTAASLPITVGAYYGSGIYNYQGNICEIIWYNRGLLDSEIYQIEGYLAWKWGLQSNLPAAHPYNISLNLIPFSRTFLPTDITGCQLWLDGADASTITYDVSPKISGWADKSPNRYNAIQATAANQPSFSGSGVVFNVASSTSLTTTYTAVPSAETVFIVMNPTTINNGTYAFDIVSTTANGGRQISIYQSQVITSAYGVATNCQTPSITASQTIVIEMTYAGTGASIVHYYNGILQVDTSTGTSAFSGAGTTKIGAGLTTFFAGTIYEVICYNSVLSSSQRQQVEGYLAWKWNLTASFPIPLVSSPTNITGCVLWLDAADSSSITLSGSNVTMWNDKSGLGNNATAVSNPTLGTINGFQAMNTNNAPYFRGAISITGTTLTCFAIATTTLTLPNSSHDQRLVSLANTTNVDYNRVDSTIALFNQGTSSTISTYRNSIFTGSNAITTNTPFIAVSQYDNTKGYLWENGAAGTLTGTASTGSFAITKYGIGNAANPSGEFWVGAIGEVIIYNTVLSTVQRQQVEGYLAKKWNLNSVLAITQHPFRNYPPSSIITFNPLVVSPTFWFDVSNTKSSASGQNTIISITPNTPVSGSATVIISNSISVSGSVTISGTGTFSGQTYDGSYTATTLTSNSFQITSSNTIYFPNIPLVTDVTNPFYLNTFKIDSTSSLTCSATATAPTTSITTGTRTTTGTAYTTASYMTGKWIQFSAMTGGAPLSLRSVCYVLSDNGTTITVSLTKNGAAVSLTSSMTAATIVTHVISISDRNNISGSLATNCITCGLMAAGSGLTTGFQANIYIDDWTSGTTSNIILYNLTFGDWISIGGVSSTFAARTTTSVTIPITGYANYNFSTATAIPTGSIVSISDVNNSGNNGKFYVISTSTTNIYIYNPLAVNSTSAIIVSYCSATYPYITFTSATANADILYLPQSNPPSMLVCTKGTNTITFELNTTLTSFSYPYFLNGGGSYAAYLSFTINAFQSYGPTELFAIGPQSSRIFLYGDGYFTIVNNTGNTIGVGAGALISASIDTVRTISVSGNAVTVPITIGPSTLGLSIGSSVSFSSVVTSSGNISVLFSKTGSTLPTATAIGVSSNAVTITLSVTPTSLDLRVGSRIYISGATSTSGNLNFACLGAISYTPSINIIFTSNLIAKTVTIPVTSNPSALVSNSWVFITGTMNFGAIYGLWKVSSVTTTSITIYANFADGIPRYFTSAGSIYASNPNYWELTAFDDTAKTITFNMLNNIPTNGATFSAGSLAIYPNPSRWILTGINDTNKTITFNMTNNIPVTGATFTTTTAYYTLVIGTEWSSGDTFRFYSNATNLYLYKTSGTTVTKYGPYYSFNTDIYNAYTSTMVMSPRFGTYSTIYNTMYFTNVAYYLLGIPTTTITSNGTHAIYACDDLSNSGIVVGSLVNIYGYTTGTYNKANVIIIAKTTNSITIASTLATGTYGGVGVTQRVCLANSYFQTTCSAFPSQVTSLNDIGGTGYNLPYTISTDPYTVSLTNNLNTMDLSSKPAIIMPSQLNGTSYAVLSTGDFSIFGLFYFNINSTLQPLLRKSGNTTVSTNPYVDLSITAANQLVLSYNNGTAIVSITSSTLTTGLYIVSVVVNRTVSAATSNYINLNGVLSGSNATSNNTTIANSASWMLGGSGCLAKIGEVMLLYSTISTFQRQQLEGYLAWKWGITLPTTHPYYKVRP